MVQLGDFLSKDTKKNILIKPGSIFLGPMVGVDHDKFYIVVGVAKDKICLCSVLINSRIDFFINKRPDQLKLQLPIKKEDYDFLDHDSYINCANPIEGRLDKFSECDFSYKALLKDADFNKVINYVKESGVLDQDQIDMFF
jgi:hypothetical protein